MTKRQKIIIICIIMVPVIIGIALFNRDFTTPGGNIPFVAQGKKIGLVKIFDIIYSSEDYVKQLQELRKDKSVAGVLVRVNSPGGGVAPSQEIFEEITRFKNEEKPLVVSMGNVAASGGYYISSPAIKIFANPGTITGSIGVIFQFPHYYNLLNKIGIKMTTIKAGKLKDVGNPNRDLTEKEIEFLQKLLDNTHEQFINDVSFAREIDIEELRKLADGRIFTGEQAFEAGLIDSLGGYSDALSYLREYLNLPEKTKVIEKKKRPGFLREALKEGLIKYIPFLNRKIVPAGCYFLLENF